MSSIKIEQMKKEDGPKELYSIEDENHQIAMTSGLCKMMLGQSLVDLAITCGNNTIHVHKIVLAANSTYFREHLEKNTNTDEIIINGLDFSILKSIIEYMYCGETSVGENHYKYIIAAAAMFKIKGLQCLESELAASDDNKDAPIHIPPPTFLSKKTKGASAAFQSNDQNIKSEKNNANITSSHKKIKRKCIRNEAERACAKEAAASHMALELLKKELASSQFSSFVVEESCTETTVENFIPHNEDIYIENELTTVPIQLNYDFNNPNASNQIVSANILPYIVPPSEENVQGNVQNVNNNTSPGKNQIVDENLQNNMKILLKTDDGNFINVKNVTVQKVPEGLQYQIIDENGDTNELQEIKNDNIYILENDVQKKFNDNIHKFLNVPNTETTLTDNVVNKVVQNELETERHDAFDTNNYEEIVEMDYGKLNQPNFENLNFILSENSDSYPVFVSSASKDPLSEACDIAENLSLIVDNKDRFNCNFDDVSTNIAPETDITSQSNHNKYLINDKVLVERNFMEYSPRNLQGGRLLNVEVDVHIDCTDENYKKKM